MDLAVIIPTYSPDPVRLARTLTALAAQTLPAPRWEAVAVDNDPSRPLERKTVTTALPIIRIVSEPKCGLTQARRRGVIATTAPLIVFVDDDNVLAPDYLANVVRLFATHEKVGAIGGRSLPEFERKPEPWQEEFFPLLALRDPGATAQRQSGLRPPGATCNVYPSAAPIGAGMSVRRAALAAWLADAGNPGMADRRGDQLSSGGDNDIVFSVMKGGWEVGYFPDLTLTHLIPARRLDAGYLARLNRGIQKSWMQVLSKHDANPWPPLAPWTVPLRKLKAWFTHRAWASPAARIRWQGACGHFEGRALGH